MQQREVTDNSGTIWTCVQAYAGTIGKNAEEATELSKDKNQLVPVVCTPSGGAQTVRLQLDEDWLDQLKDEELVQKIEKESGK